MEADLRTGRLQQLWLYGPCGRRPRSLQLHRFGRKGARREPYPTSLLPTFFPLKLRGATRLADRLGPPEGGDQPQRRRER
jgi:hypothetical protein